MKKNSSHAWPIILFTIGVFMAGLDNGIISAALTTIYNSFHVSPSWGAWTVTLYTLGVAIAVPVIGKLSDNYGRKRLFIIEVFLFGVGSLFVALSPNFVSLLLARFIQAIGGGGIFIIASSYVLATLPKDKQGKMLGIIGGMHGLSAVVGPNVGALILKLTDSWEWMFLINLPIALFLIVMAVITMAETKKETAEPLDLKGVMYLTLAIIFVMYSITNIDGTRFITSLMQMNTLPYFVAGIILLIIFIRHEKMVETRGGDPIISYELLKNRAFQMTLTLGFLAGGFLASIIFIPSYVQQALQVPAENAGFWLTPLALASGVGSGLGGYLTDRIGSIRTVITAGIIGFCGFFLFVFTAETFTTFLIASILVGIALGFMLGAPLNVLVRESAEKRNYGAALGSLSLMRQIGLALFPAVFASFISAGVMQIEPAVVETYGEPVITFPAVEQGEGYGEIIEQIDKLDDSVLKAQLHEIVSSVMKTGFQGLFFSAIIVSLFVLLISGFMLIKNSTNTALHKK